MTGPKRSAPAHPARGRSPARPGTGWVAVASGLVVVLAYLAGTGLGGRLSPLARRPLLDGLAPPPPYHWVKPPPELASGNRPPSGVTGAVQLSPTGTLVTAISTGDGQANLLMEANAIAPAAGQRSVEVRIQPVDAATLAAAAPPGLVLAGNAYLVRFSYQPSGKPVTALAGKATISLTYPLLPIPVSSQFDYAVLASADGKAWTKQASTATPGSHQVASTLPAPGYVIAAVPPAPAEATSPNRTPLFAGLAAAAVLVAVAAIVLARRLRAAPEGYDDDDYDDDDDGDNSGEDPDPGTEERR